MRKSITTRYFYATALLLIASTALMGFIQMYLSMVFFRAQSDAGLLLTVDNTIQILQEVYGTTPDYDIANDLINREVTLTARASNNNIFVADVYGKIVLGSTRDSVEYIEEHYINAYLPEKAVAGARTLVHCRKAGAHQRRADRLCVCHRRRRYHDRIFGKLVFHFFAFSRTHADGLERDFHCAHFASYHTFAPFGRGGG